MNKSIHIPANGTWQETTLWDGNLHNDGKGHTFGMITPDNVMVKAAVSEGTPYTKYSNPPNGAPFTSYYVDETVGAEPGSLGADAFTIPETGGKANFTLAAGSANGSRNYFVLGSLSGTEPGIPLPGGMVTLPLNWDFFTNVVYQLANTPAFMNFQGTLDANGNATATFDTLGALPPGLVGVNMNFAYLVISPFDYVSNPVAIEIVP